MQETVLMDIFHSSLWHSRCLSVNPRSERLLQAYRQSLMSNHYCTL